MIEPSLKVDAPIAFFLTWTTYGTWLPGDQRGSWHEGRLQPPNDLFREMAMSEMKETAFLLTSKDRETVENTIRKHCEIRGWTLRALSVRSNHVHVVVTAPGFDPKTVRDQFKAWCTRHLKLAYPSRKRFWTEGGSCRSINHEDGLATVMIYVMDSQGRKDLDE